MLDRNDTAWTPNAGARRLSALGSRHVTVALIGVLSLCLAACGAQPEAETEAAGSAPPVAETEAADGHEHADAHTAETIHDDIPADGIILEDLMELMNMKFGTVRQEGGKIGADAEARHKAREAAESAQRYLRVAKKEFAPDPGFHEFADDAIAAWATVEASVRAGDVASLKARIQSLGATCKACHDVYREAH